MPYQIVFIVCVCENQRHIQCWLLWTLVVNNLHVVYFRHIMRLTYGTIKYLPYVRSHLASWLVSLGCSLSADPSITDSGLHQREHPQNLTQSDPPPVDLSVADIQWQIVAEWSRDSTMVGCNRERIGNQHRCFELYGQWLGGAMV